MKIDRRTLLVAGGAGVGLIVAFALWPRGTADLLSTAPGEEAFNQYVKVGRDGRVTIVLPQAETGQGAWTGLAQIVADAMGADWKTVSVEPAPYAPGHYDNELMGSRITAGATSIRAFEQPLKEGGALARSLLVGAAASRWGVSASECVVADGQVRHGGKALGFGELAENAAGRSGSGNAGELAKRLLGEPLPRVDGAAKATGAMRFAGDVRLPTMRFASARLAPPGGRLNRFDRAAAKAAHPDAEIIAGEDWVAGVADSWWKAEQALKSSAPTFEANADATTEAIDVALDEALASGGRTIASRGDVDGAFGNAEPLQAEYRISPTMHLGLEPWSVAARFTNDRLELWAPTQAYDLAVAIAAEAADIPAADILFYPLPVGAPGGGALEPKAIPVAIALARQLKAPVSVTLSASTSQNHTVPRAPMVAKLAAVPERSGGLRAYRAQFATKSGLHDALARIGGENDVDQLLDGAEPPYGIDNLDVTVAEAEVPVPFGYMRGGSAALTAFAHESFIDEVAKQLGREPLSFRIAMLSGNRRLAAVLMAVSRRANWDGGAPGSPMGLACASAFGSHIALIAQASLAEDQSVQVERLVAAVDCGRAINPGLVAQQVEGSLIDAFALANTRAPKFVGGMPVARSPRGHGLKPGLAVPEIDIELVAGSEEPGGVSGLGHLVLPAAVANSLAARTGLRLRNLPFDPMAA